MIRHLACVVLLAWFLCLPGDGGYLTAQGAAPLAKAKLVHVGVAVRDVDHTARVFADILGIDVPKSHIVSLDGPGHQKVQLKVALLNTVNFQVELDQPIAGISPTKQFLDAFGLGIQHLGFTVQGPIDDRVRALEKAGGVLTLGAADGRYAFVRIPQLGTTIELVQEPSGSSGADAKPAGRTTDALANRRISHVGLVLGHAEPALRLAATLLGVAAPQLQVFSPIDYLPGSMSNPDAHVRYAQIPAGNVSIEFIEPVGAPSPWADFVKGHEGTAVHHIAFGFSAGDHFDTAVRRLREKGGIWRKGKRGFDGETRGSSPEFEFFDTLGMVIETSGSVRP